MALVIAIAGAIALYQVRKAAYRNQADRKLLEMLAAIPALELADLAMQYDFQKLSCLIAGVYVRDFRTSESPMPYFNGAGYVEATTAGTVLSEYYDAHVMSTTRSALLLEDERARSVTPGMLEAFKDPYVKENIVVFVRVDEVKNVDPVAETEGLSQKYVVAVRGTLLKRLRDLKDDARVVLETLHSADENYRPIITLIMRLVELDPSVRVAVVGHSLGASLALLVARSLALDHNIIVDCHLFNLPNITLNVLFKKIFTGAVNAVSDSTEHILGTNVREGVRKVGHNVAKRCSRMMRSVLPSDTVVVEEAQRLLSSGFCPRIYTNPRDPISNEFYNALEGVRVQSTAAPVVKLSGADARSYHLVPAGILLTSNWGSGFDEAHSLSQWYKYVNRTEGLPVENRVTLKVEPFTL